MSQQQKPTFWVFAERRSSGPTWSVKWMDADKAIKRQVGRAWLADPASPDAKPGGRVFGAFVERRGRPRDGWLNYADALAGATSVMAAWRSEAAMVAAEAEALLAEASRPATFRELAHDWLRWIEHVKGCKPSTLAGYRQMLSEPGIPHRRGRGVTPGYIMSGLGAHAANEVTTADVNTLLATIRATGVSPRTVNAHRAVIRTIFSFGVRQTEAALTAGGTRTATFTGREYGLRVNPVKASTPAREAGAPPLAYYRPEEIEALARTLADGEHRTISRAVSPDDKMRQQTEDEQDAEAVRVSAYAGLRLGELLELRWRDIDWAGSAITVSRSVSAGEVTPPKSGRIRRVPLPDQAAAALDRLSRRPDFTAPDELVFCNPVTGRHLNGSALRRRYKAAQAAAGLAPLRWHDLRHTYGSLLAADPQVELITIKSAMGHQHITTTERYLHARPATDVAAAFTRAFAANGNGVQPTANEPRARP